MAIVDKKVISHERMFECDKCKKTKSMSLAMALQESARGDTQWMFFKESERCLCPACVLTITEAWYNQQDTENFHLTNSSGDLRKRRIREVV